MNDKDLNKYFEALNAKRHELVKARIANDKNLINCLEQDIDFLRDLCFFSENNNLLIPEE